MLRHEVCFRGTSCGGLYFVDGRIACRRNGFLRALTATCRPRSIVQLQHIVWKITSPTHCGSDTLSLHVEAEMIESLPNLYALLFPKVSLPFILIPLLTNRPHGKYTLTVSEYLPRRLRKLTGADRNSKEIR